MGRRRSGMKVEMVRKITWKAAGKGVRKRNWYTHLLKYNTRDSSSVFSLSTSDLLSRTLLEKAFCRTVDV